MKKILIILAILALAAASYAAEATQRDYNFRGFHYAETIATTETGETVKIPTIQMWRNITVTLVAGANTGKIQTTTSSDAAVAAGTATWADWDLGTQTGTVSDVITGPVTGIRGVSVSGEVKIEIVY
jgi:uncharacterized protein YcfJ